MPSPNQPKRIFIAGALSAIAQETARCFAAEGASFFLAGRSAERLRICAEDLQARGAVRVQTLEIDFDLTQRHAAAADEAAGFLGGIDAALIAYGVLPDQSACEKDFALARKAIETNFLSVISLSMALVPFLEKSGGTLAVLGSVAGDRGRPKNYIYGAAKGGLERYLQGLRASLSRRGVHVLTIKPGFVDTPMTAHLKKGILFAPADRVGRDIYRAVLARKDILYVPWFWRWILFAIRAVPEGLFKKLRL